jgi:tetratricopeptide (TPR) repeat protein
MNIPASSAAPSIARVCYRHSDSSGNHTCTTCRRPICDGCLSVGGGFEAVCSSCVLAAHKRAQGAMAGAMIAALVIVAGGIGFVATRPAPIEYGEHRIEIERLSARVEASPCDGQTTLTLADLLNKERDYRRVVAVVDAFRLACKPVPRMYWESYGARMQVQDFAGAVDDATRLIDDDQDDGDFWWWRAKAKRQLGDKTGAEADFRRSAEISGKRAFYSVIDLADMLEEQTRACEAVPLLAQIAKNYPDEAKKNGVITRLSRLVRETPCPDPSAAMPNDDAAPLCATLPEKLVVDAAQFGAASGFELSLSNAWEARTRTVAKGKPVKCTAEVEKNDVSKNSILAGSSMQSWSGRLICEGLSSTTAVALSPIPLKAQEELVAKLLDAGIRRWCGAP